MRSVLKYLPPLLVLAAIACGVQAWREYQRSRAEPGPAIAFEPVVDLGKVDGSEVPVNVTVRNVCDQPVQIVGYRTGCGEWGCCGVRNMERVTIEPGGTHVIQFVVSTAGWQGASASKLRFFWARDHLEHADVVVRGMGPQPPAGKNADAP